MNNIQPTEISSEMKRAYLNYAMSVIVARALPDVRDGLKPVHRRILFAMYKLGLTAGARFSKSAKVVGEVLGKYHPHGDSPVYEALVRMAQEFSMRYPLIRGQGNFGSIDGDPPAAMRYTEIKLTKIAEEMLFDIDKETVPFIANFDGSLDEPRYLPSKLPNVLLMGAEGIAVGMATKIPPHNLTELIDGLCFMIDKAKLDQSLVFDVTLDELLIHIKGPDFPTAGIIYGAGDIQQAYATGKGKLIVRAKVSEEEYGKGKTAIIVDELPYQVNKANLIEKIAALVRDKKIVGISDLRDESDRDGIRVVIELKRDTAYKKVLNNLYKHTELQTSFPLNMVVLVDGTPQTLPLTSILSYYLKHRVEVVTKRSQYELKQAKHRAHILDGLLIALDHIDEVIETIKKSESEPAAKTNLMDKFSLTDIQAQAILDMQLKRLTGLERSKIEEELKMLKKTIDYLEGLLKDVFKILKVVKDELIELKSKFGDERRTKIYKYKPGEFSDEELIENKEVIVILTKEGYIKQIPKETFKVQQRGGKGVAGFDTREEDNVYYITTAMTHDSILFFTDKGKVYQTRVWEIPAGSRTSKGKAIANLINIVPEENITSILTYHNKQTAIGNQQLYIVMCTRLGTIKKTALSEFLTIRANGIIAIRLDENDGLCWAHITDGKKMIVLATHLGQAIVFPEQNVKPTGRSSMGVRGIDLDPHDSVSSMDIFNKEETGKKLLVLSQKGIGKKTLVKLFRQQKRAGKGVRIATVDEKNGHIIFSRVIENEDETIIITSKKGQVVKIPLKSIPTLSRTAKGVILMRFSNKTDQVAAATFI